MSRSGSENRIQGVDLLFHGKGGSASFGAKMVLSLNGVDPSCMNSFTGSTCRAKYSDILHDKAGFYLTHKYTVWLKIFAVDKRSSLLLSELR